MRVWSFICIAGFFIVMLIGCGQDQSKGGTAPDTAFGDVPEAGQVPGQGRIDRGGGATADGYKPDSITNYTEPGSGLQRTN